MAEVTFVEGGRLEVTSALPDEATAAAAASTYIIPPGWPQVITLFAGGRWVTVPYGARVVVMSDGSVRLATPEEGGA